MRSRSALRMIMTKMVNVVVKLYWHYVYIVKLKNSWNKSNQYRIWIHNNKLHTVAQIQNSDIFHYFLMEIFGDIRTFYCLAKKYAHLWDFCAFFWLVTCLCISDCRNLVSNLRCRFPFTCWVKFTRFDNQLLQRPQYRLSLLEVEPKCCPLNHCDLVTPYGITDLI